MEGTMNNNIIALPKNIQDLQQPIQTSPSKSIQRSKTVRNLGSAGNKVRGLFKKKENNQREIQPEYKNSNTARPPMTTSVSLNSLSDHRYIERPISYPDSHAMEKSLSSGDNNNNNNNRYSTFFKSFAQKNNIMSSNTISSKTSSPTEQDIPVEAEELKHQLDQLNATINKVRQEVASETEKKQQLQHELEESRRLYQEREAEYSKIEHNFFQLTRSVRATDDDLSTIRDSLKLLKYNVSRVIMTLNKKADKEKAKAKFVATWPNLKLVDDNGELLEPSYINFLAEKLLHEHLVKSIFQCPMYPGLEINGAYDALSRWFTEHDSTFSVRLRQQLAVILVKSKPDSELQQAVQQEKKRITDLIYQDLTEIYDPFIRENDNQVSGEKSYYYKISDIVDKAFKLTIAIRGQDVDISALNTEEGTQEIDEETMVDVRGKTSGTVRFCICPIFVGGDGEHGFLEKGKVVVV